MILLQRPTVKRTSTVPDGAVRGDQASDLQLLVDSAPSLLHTTRPDGYFDCFNQTWLTYVGRSLAGAYSDSNRANGSAYELELRIQPELHGRSQCLADELSDLRVVGRSKLKFSEA
jgi:hypothetical protein